ncbi:MAG: PAS domain S-box protein, partial [Candidatus Brocadiales bacterium]|nr:PAS domain S-box protein [Candidatus Brocadiales bacterium]
MNYEKMTKAELITRLKSLESDIENSGSKEEKITLHGSEEKYHQLIKSLNDAVILVDVESGIILETNKRTEDLLGVPVEKIVGMNRSQMYPPEDIERYDKIYQKYVRIKGGKTTENIFIQHKDGHKIPVEISSNVFELNDRRVLLAIFRDITRQQQVKNSLKESENRYRDIVRSMSDW